MKKVMAIALSTGAFLILLSLWVGLHGWKESGLFLFTGILFEVISLLAYLIYRYQEWHFPVVRKLALLGLGSGAILVFGAGLSSFWDWPLALHTVLFGVGVQVFSLFCYFAFYTKKATEEV